MTDSMNQLRSKAEDYRANLEQGQRRNWLTVLSAVPEENRLALAALLIPIEIGFRARNGEEIDPRVDYPNLSEELYGLLQKEIEVLGNRITIDQPKNRTSHYEPQSGRSASDGRAPQFLGPYKLLHKIGEGGMGEVWMAEQERPIRRRVAIKLIKSGQDTKQVVARFEAERQALSMMNHQNIARVLDVGTTGDGQPFFVMELVQGIPFSTYCDKNKLSIKERLSLFIPVCEAVQHAHQKGIIHRDLKPSNVLVCLSDGRPTPKVIDFGLAKALQHTTRLTDKTMFTEIGQVVGTLQYMSPEQAEMNQLDIDTRTDVYSLGVMLYELLTGSTPLDRHTLGNQAILKILELIREQEPPLPSLRLSSVSPEAASGVSRQRKIEPGKLKNILRGELDWIVMKTLEKDRSRRYESASELAIEIQRYLSGDLVRARPPSRSYLVQKYIRKHRGLVASLVSIFALLLIGIAGTSWGMFRANEESIRSRAAEKDAEIAKVEAQQAAVSERKSREQSELRLRQVELGNDTLGGIFKDLDIRAIDKSKNKLEVVLAKRLIAAGSQIKGDSIGDPTVVAKLQSNLGFSLVNLGFAKDAIQLLEDCVETFTAELGRSDPKTLSALTNLAVCYNDAGFLDKALPLAEEAYSIGKSVLGDDQEKLLAIMNSLGSCYEQSGKLDQALPLREQTLEVTKKVFGNEHPKTLTCLNNLGSLYFAAGKPEKALPYIEQTLETIKIVLGPEHPNTLATMNNLAALYRTLGRLEEAIPLYEETLKLRLELLGAEHPETLISMNNLAVGYRSIGDLEKALPLIQQTLEQRKVKLGVEHPDTLLTATNLGTVYLINGQTDLAIPLLNEALEFRKAKLGMDHPDTIKGMKLLGDAYLANRQSELAVSHYQDSVQHSEGKFPADDPLKLSAMMGLATALFVNKQSDQAKKLSKSVLEILSAKRQTLGKQATSLNSQLIEMSDNLIKVHQHEAAEPFVRECLSICSEFDPDAWVASYAKTLLGSALVGQSIDQKELDADAARVRWSDAETLLNSGYEGLIQRAEDLPIKLRRKRQLEAIDRLIELYRVNEDGAALQKWEQKRREVLAYNQ